MTPTLPPLQWQPLPITPLPDVFIDDTPSAWAIWDAAVRAMDEVVGAACAI
jgi:hypothetical protein